MSYSQIPESPPAAKARKPASKKDPKQKENQKSQKGKQKQKERGKVCIITNLYNFIMTDFIAKFLPSPSHRPRFSNFCGSKAAQIAYCFKCYINFAESFLQQFIKQKGRRKKEITYQLTAGLVF